jgi:nucleoside-diphosphate-sugar epimerase
MKTTLVTGASGFLGRHLLRCLAGRDVVAVYSSSTGFVDWLRAEGHDVSIRPLRADLANAADVHRLCAQVGNSFGTIFHLAARVDIPRSMSAPAEDLVDNGCMTINVATLLHCDHLVHLSSGAVYEGQDGLARRDLPLRPTLPYAIHKILAECYVESAVKRFGTAGRATIVRFFGAYGPFEAPSKIYSRLAYRFGVERVPEISIYGDGSNLIDAMWIEDACTGLLTVSEHSQGESVRVLDFTCGRPMSISHLATTACRVLLGCDPVIARFGTANECNRFFGDASGLQACFGIAAPTPLETGLKRLCDHLLQQRR